jgi:anti-sigma regulatory factor (Ser/Thr protein kinase)
LLQTGDLTHPLSRQPEEVRRLLERALEHVLRIGNRTGEVPGALDAVEEFCRGLGLAAETALEVRLVAEEVLTNLGKYAHAGNDSHGIVLRLSGSTESVRLEFRDQGPAFNPLTAPLPDLTVPPEQRGIGGLGLLLVRALVDEATYVREGNVNTLVLMKRVGSTV